MYYYVSEEWAAQLAHDHISSGIDFGKLKVSHVGRSSNYRIPIRLSDKISPLSEGDVKVETVEMQQYDDLANGESTWLGYGLLTNTLLLGETTGFRSTHTGRLLAELTLAIASVTDDFPDPLRIYARAHHVSITSVYSAATILELWRDKALSIPSAPEYLRRFWLADLMQEIDPK